MAWAQKKGDSWYCEFRYQRRRHHFTIGEVAEIEARATVAKVDYLLMRFKQHLLDIPAGGDIVTFLRYDGKPPSHPPAPPAKLLTLAQLHDDYFHLHAKVFDPRTVADMWGHWKHLARLLNDKTEAEALTLAALQDYVLARDGRPR